MNLKCIVLSVGLSLISCESSLNEISYLGTSNENNVVEKSKIKDTGKQIQDKKDLNCKNEYGTNPTALFDSIVSSPHDGLLSLKNNDQTFDGFLYMRDTFGSSYDGLLSDFVSFYDGIKSEDREDLVCWTRYVARTLDEKKCFDFDIVKESYWQAEKSINESYSDEIIKQRVRTARNLSSLLGINTMNQEKNLLDVAYQRAINHLEDKDKLTFARSLAEGTGVDVSNYENIINP